METKEWVEELRKSLSKGSHVNAFEVLTAFDPLIELNDDLLLILIDCLSCPYYPIREHALIKLEPFTHIDFVRSAVIQGMQDDASRIREATADILSKHIESDKTILPLLKNSLRDESPFVVDKILTILEPYIEKDKEFIINECLQNKYLLLNTFEILKKYTIGPKK